MSKNWTVILTLTLILASCSKHRTANAPKNTQSPVGSTDPAKASELKQPVTSATENKTENGTPGTPAKPTDDHGKPAVENTTSKVYPYTLDDKILKANYDAVKYCSDLVGAADKGIPVLVLHGKEFYLDEQTYPAGLARKIEQQNLLGANQYLLVRDANTPRDKLFIHIKRQIGNGYSQEVKNECVNIKYSHIVFEQENDTAKLKFNKASKLGVNEYECYMLSVSQKKLNKKVIKFRLQEVSDHDGAAVHNKIIYTNDRRDVIKVKETDKSRKERRAERKASKKQKSSKSEQENAAISSSSENASRAPVTGSNLKESKNKDQAQVQGQAQDQKLEQDQDLDKDFHEGEEGEEGETKE